MSDKVLYQRDKASDDDNPWDDTLLIKAYENAVNSVHAKRKEKTEKEEVKADTEFVAINGDQASSAEEHSEEKSKPVNRVRWKTGMHCRATYSEDGLEYEAVVLFTKPKKGTCRLRYIGYDNEEVVPLSSLKPSLGEYARQAQISQSLTEADDMNATAPHEAWTGPGAAGGFSPAFGVMPPPPHPPIPSNLPRDEQQAFSALLMSWYMSGFYAGFYQAAYGSKLNKKK